MVGGDSLLMCSSLVHCVGTPLRPGVGELTSRRLFDLCRAPEIYVTYELCCSCWRCCGRNPASEVDCDPDVAAVVRVVLCGGVLGMRTSLETCEVHGCSYWVGYVYSAEACVLDGCSVGGSHGAVTGWTPPVELTPSVEINVLKSVSSGSGRMSVERGRLSTDV